MIAVNHNAWTVAVLALLLAACGGTGNGTMPDRFRVDAEIVSVTGPSPSDCTPTTLDVNPTGPDWQLLFDRVNDAAPIFGEQTSSRNPDGGRSCAPIADRGGGGWVLACDGAPGTGDGGINHFVFTFTDDWSGTATSTHAGTTRGGCVATTSWTTIVPML